MKLQKVILIILAVSTCSIIIQSCAQTANAEKPAKEVFEYTTLQWNTLENIEATVKNDPKPVIIDVYTDWCKWCKVMDQQTFSDANVVQYLQQNYHMVKLNAEQKEAINFKGKQYNYVQNGRRGYNQVAAELCKGQLSYPSFVVLDKNLNPVQILKGFKSPDQLLGSLQNI